MAVWVALAGAVFGGLWAGTSFGGAVVAVLALLLLRHRALERHVRELQQALQALQSAEVVRAAAADTAAAAAPLQRAAVELPTPAQQPATQPAPQPEAQAAPASPMQAAAPAHQPPHPPLQPPPPPRPQPQPAPAAGPAATAPAPTPWARAQAWLLGGNTIARLGVGILFVGLAFLARYAAEHTQVPVEWRLAGIGGVALVLLALGWRLRVRRPGYAQALQGGAIAVLYLTLFVAFRWYGVIGAAVGFAAMAAVALLAAALAVLQDARALAVIGALGGFATPLLVSTGSNNQVALFAYYLVLDLGIAAVAWFRTWRLLNAVGFTFTFVVATAWGLLSYRPEHYASSQAFLIAYFLLFNAVLLLPARPGRPPLRGDGWVNGSLLFGLPAITFVLQHGLVRHLPYGTALSALLLAAFYVALATRMRRHPGLGVPFDASLAIAVVFLTLVVPYALDAHATAGAWALEAAGLVWLGLRQQRLLPRLAGYALLLLASATMALAQMGWHQPVAGVIGAGVIGAALLLAGALAAAAALARHGQRGGALPQAEHAAEPLLIGLAVFWALATVALQLQAWPDAGMQPAAWVVGTSLVALLFGGVADRLRWPRGALPALGHAPLMLLATAAGPWIDGGPVAHGGWWAWPVALGTHALLLARTAPLWPARAAQGVHALGALLLATLGALLGRALTAGWGDAGSAWSWLGWLVAPALLLVLLTRPSAALRWPLRAEPLAYQAGAGGVLAAALLLWTLLANAGSAGGAAPLPHVPLLNPLDLGVAAALAAAWTWQRSAAGGAALAGLPQVAPALSAGCAFVWLNAMLLRAFHHYAGVPWRPDAWADTLAVQTGLTLLWSATALAVMWLSARRAQRLPWLVGAGLLGAVTLKLLLVDLSGAGTVTRIVSFIGVGLVMLAIGYVAPVPTAGKPSHASR